MKRFVYKTLIYLTIISIVISSVEIIYRKNNTLDDDGTLKFDNVPEKIEICNFGSSHGQLSFNYAKYEKEINCFNFGLTGQSLSYDYRILKNYINNIDKGSTVFIVISYFSLTGNDEVLSNDFKSKNKKYYKILKPENIKEFDLETYVLMQFRSLDTGLNNLIKATLGISISNEKVYDRYSHKSTKEEIIKILEDEEDFTFDGEIKEKKSIIINKEEIKSLYNMIDLIKNVGGRPILITTPVTLECNMVYYYSNPSFFDDFNSIVSLVAKETGVEYYNYGNDERFIERYDYFFDYHHLNKYGSEAFTDIVFDEVIRKGKS